MIQSSCTTSLWLVSKSEFPATSLSFIGTIVIIIISIINYNRFYYLTQNLLFVHKMNFKMLLQNHAKVIELINKLLSQILSQSAPSKFSKDSTKKLALSVAERCIFF